MVYETYFWCDASLILVSLQVASDNEHCIIRREHEKCMDLIELHNPDGIEFGK